MSVIRRKVRSQTPDFNFNRENTPPSEKSVIKSAMVRRYLEESWLHSQQLRCGREERSKILMEKLDESNLTETEKNEIINEFKKEETNFTRVSRIKFKPDDYNYIKLIGRGGVADVWLVTDKKSGGIYAMKIIRKTDVIKNDQTTAVKNERNILAKANNSWIVHMFCSFQDEENLYLILEFVQGGDLMNLLCQLGVLPVSACRFFCGEIVLAVHFVHQLGYVHADLKPDNILISNDGHIKLTDFGIASNYVKPDNEYKQLVTSAQGLMLDDPTLTFTPSDKRKHRERNSIMGTLDYTAPEVLMGEPPTEKSDWWSLGVILYEMLYGFTPFSCETKEATAHSIINWKKTLNIPYRQKVPAQAAQLVKSLLCDKEDRIGYEEIISHPFFANFNFMDAKANKVPMKPYCSDPLSTEHFDNIEVKQEELRGSSQITPFAYFAFLGFTYKSKPPSAALAKLDGNLEER